MGSILLPARVCCAAGICRSRHCALMGLLVVMVTAIFLCFPLFKTSLDRALGLPCPYSGLKEKEQLVFALCLMKGKPNLAKRNLNQIGGLKKKKQGQSALTGWGEAEVGKHFEDKHCGFSAVGEAYLMCSCWRDKWTLAVSFRGVWVPGPAEIPFKPSVYWCVLQSWMSPLTLVGFGASRASPNGSRSATAGFKSKCRAGSPGSGLAQSFMGLFLLRELNHPCNCGSQDCLL